MFVSALGTYTRSLAAPTETNLWDLHSDLLGAKHTPQGLIDRLGRLQMLLLIVQEPGNVAKLCCLLQEVV